MNEQEFQAAAERITNLFRNGGLGAAAEERDRINRELAVENSYLDFRSTGADSLGFFLLSLTTNEELFRTTMAGILK